MKTKLAIIGVLVAALIVLGTGCNTTSGAKISRADAEKIALARVPNGVIKEATPHQTECAKPPPTLRRLS